METMDTFFETVSSLMSLILRSMIENTLSDLVSFLNCFRDGNNYENEKDLFKKFLNLSIQPPFTLDYVVNRSSEAIEIEINTESIILIFNEIIDGLINSLNDIKRVEYLLFEDMNLFPVKYFNMVNSTEQFVLEFKAQVREIIVSNMTGPVRFIKTYQPYQYLFSGECGRDTDKFLNKDKSLAQYEKKIEYLKNLISKIRELPASVPMNLFLLNCIKVNKWLRDEAQNYIDKMINKILSNNLKFNRSICEKFEKILSRITKKAETPGECVELLKFIENVRYVECYQLLDLIGMSAQNVLFIIDYSVFSKEDFKWNNYTFTWYENLQPLINRSEMTLLKEKEVWIARVKEKRTKLVTKINECLSHVKELKTRDRISDVSDICQELNAISNEVDGFISEVNIRFSLIFCLLDYFLIFPL